jgi:L-alanine-DL-glutamate epimerase-like enolase superfamily enzyme
MMSRAASNSPWRSRPTIYSGWKSRCIGIYSEPISSASPLSSPVPLAHGEWEPHRYTVRDFIDFGTIRYLRFSSTRHAGFTESLRIAYYAEQRGMLIAPYSVGHLHGHLVLTFGDAAFAAESRGNPGRHPLHHGIYRGGGEVRDGRVH